LRGQILLMQAECTADKIAGFIQENKNQVGLTTQLPSTGGYSIEQRRFDALRLLRQDLGAGRYALRWRERRRA
jgi:hypothetical protein